MGMFAVSRKSENNEEIEMPKTMAHWMYGTSVTSVLYDSTAPITTTTQKPARPRLI